MSFTAKAIVGGVIDNLNDTATITFNADYNDDRNKEWSKYTPWLNFELNVTSDFAQSVKAGQAYVVTFEESD